MKHIFILNSGYPTQKAYGITTKYSIEALSKLGESVELWAPKSDFPLSESFTIIDTSPFMPRILDFIPSGRNSFFSFAKFQINEILFSFKVLFFKKGFISGNVIWVRDISLAFWSLALGIQTRVILEIHHFPKGIPSLMLRAIANSSKVTLTGITAHHVQKLQKTFHPRNKVLFTPMAAPPEFFQEYSLTREFNCNVGYVGKLTSSGKSNGIFEMLDDFALFARSREDATLTLIGMEEESLSQLNQHAQTLNIESQLKIVSHLSGSELIKAFKKLDVGLIPYPDSVYNNSRFPIKILEYAALGVTLLASDISAHRGILSEDRAFFYHPGISGSLSESLRLIFGNESNRDAKRISARKWAELFSYEERVKRVLNELGKF